MVVIRVETFGGAQSPLFGPSGSFEAAFDVFIKRRHKARSSLGAGGKGRIEGGRRAPSEFAFFAGEGPAGGDEGEGRG